MTPQEYQEAAARTAHGDGPGRERTLIAALGLVGEVIEFVEEPTVEEAGDVAWYCAELCTCVGLTLRATRGSVGQVDARRYLLRYAGEAAERIKKWIGHGHEVDLSALDVEIAMVLSITVRLSGASLEEVLESNVDKLRRRYPDGFSTAASIARVDRAGGGA